ncbi:Wzz/FepE/Etk N-terminal domain-containing protein [Pseudoalteromonas rubra]|uniref:Wzz/FepE/Etk N-terminal domain-containing protein n=1 Tax=Pseudoalteromonas rubra TaxID=43658 RepID=UPI000F76CC99|nr:Wzz/FepE/Etk N-terminal domain-containing protein [Pseudoalteromonas rubra]
MSENSKKSSAFNYDKTEDQINLVEMLLYFWKHKLLAISVALTLAIVGAVVSKLLPDIYESSALLAPNETDNNSGMAAIGNQFGGLASLAGIALPNAGASKVTLALELLKSRVFISEFIRKYHLEADIYATESWDKEKGELIYDKSIFDVESGAWTREKGEPTILEVYDIFLEDHLVISANEKSNFVNISVRHFSPHWAQEVLTNLVSELNEKIRAMDIKSSAKSISYLEDRLKETQVDDMRKVLFRLMEREFQKKMLAEVKDGYVFYTVDPPVVPEYPRWPKRILIVLISFIAGLVISFTGITLVYSFRREFKS